MSDLVKRADILPANVLADRVIARLREAEKALQHATTIHQAKLVADVASAQEVFAHRQRLGEDVIGYAHQIKIEALARLGELLKAMPKATGSAGPGRGKAGAPAGPAFTSAPTYADLGIDKKAASVAQQLADLPNDLRDAIANREVSLTEARRQQKRTQQPQDVQLPAGKFRVIYADPPWSYGSSGVIGSDNYGRAERHYPAMTISELCEMDVRSRVADNAVLFLWVTSPLLDECWPVIKAWGFEYKTSMVWDKVRHNYGSYVSVRHEFLLICARGSCLPDRPTPMPDSVISLERSDTHSQKPDDFRAVIDHLYVGGSDQKLELFGRGQVTGWTVYGNELASGQLSESA